MIKRPITFLVLILHMLGIISCKEQPQSLDFELQDEKLIIGSKDKAYVFEPAFTVLYAKEDPKLAMRPAGIENVSYNIPTWLASDEGAANLKEVERDDSQAGDGFDDRILEGKAQQRTPVIQNAAQNIILKPNKVTQRGDSVIWEFPEHELFALHAVVITGSSSYPRLQFQLEPKKKGYFSVGYSGAPAYALEEADEIWQPLLWQEKRFPDQAYMTLAFRSPVPTAMVNDGENTIGVMADPEEFPFDPLPTQKNSRFGIMIRSGEGKAQPQLFAPVLGEIDSELETGESYRFTSYLIVEPQPITYAYEKIARSFFDFGNYRKNAISSLNHTFQNIVNYSMSDYAWFVDSLKGYAYSTDVPGAVKNVSSLHPLELSIVTDDKEIFEERAYPMMEYMLSREKFLFSLDPEQKIQSPSRNMHGPIAPVSELVSLYNIFDPKNNFLTELAEDEYKSFKIRNLSVRERGETWYNALYMFRATGEEEYLERAKSGADKYIEERVNRHQTKFNDPFAGGFFFWTAFTNRWIELLQLYEITREEKYLKAAQDGARHYTMFTWMSPRIPDSTITVNKGGKAPLYWYLKAKGHEQMYYPEEEVPAWRLSEMGLTPESSGTSTGHRAIFMANYAPWMLRLGYYAEDEFLMDVAKAAVIGRYRNFPGYHINTARTTAYEKETYPLHEHKALSVNSFHYNHIMPMASMLLDYLVTDVFVRSDAAINFPAEYIEGYAYLQNKFYGHEKGNFYDVKNVQLWMPDSLLRIDHVELNYIAARRGDNLFLAFMNQSNETVKANVKINPDLVQFQEENLETRVWKENGDPVAQTISGLNLQDLEVAPEGITAVQISGIKTRTTFQDQLLAVPESNLSDYTELNFGDARAMLLQLGEYGQRAYIYLRKDDSAFESVSLEYVDSQGNRKVIKDGDFPYEFSVSLGRTQESLQFSLSGITTGDEHRKSDSHQIGQK